MLADEHALRQRCRLAAWCLDVGGLEVRVENPSEVIDSLYGSHSTSRGHQLSNATPSGVRAPGGPA